MNKEKKNTEIIDSYLYALVKKKGYTKEDIIDALQYIVTGKVEYKGTNHPLEKVGTRNIQKELLKSSIKKNIYNRSRGEKPALHSLDSIVMEEIEKEGILETLKEMTEKENYLNSLAEQYILDHFEFEEGDLYYSKMHEDMDSFMILKECEDLLEAIDREDELPLEDELLKEEKREVKEEPLKEELLEEFKEEPEEESTMNFSSDMEKLEYCLEYMQKRENYKDATLIDMLNRAIEGNYKVFTRENGIRTLAESVPKEVMANKKALLLMKEMEEKESAGKVMDLLDM